MVKKSPDDIEIIALFYQEQSGTKISGLFFCLSGEK